MTGRPCKPDADFKRLWQILLPGTPVPVCGVDPAAGNRAEPPAPAVEDKAEPGRGA
jgi:hypothetical protein